MLAAIIAGLAAPTSLFSQSICSPSGNLIIISNYDGGPLNINIDEDVPNIKIGLSSYEPMTVTISGTYAANVTEVWFAGYNSNANNNHCAVIATTTVSAPVGTAVTIETYPPVLLADPAGESNMIYCDECNESPYSGNTPDQVVNYFTSVMGGVLRWHKTQYGCYGSLSLSGGGNCCLGPCSVVVNAGQDLFICQGDTVPMAAVGATNYTWSPAGSLSDADVANPMAFPTETTIYQVIGTDGLGCAGVDTVVVNVAPRPDAPEIVYQPGDTLRCDPAADAYLWYVNGTPLPDTGRYIWATMPGDYTVVIFEGACSSETSGPQVFFPSPPSGLSPVDPFQWLIYPNPASQEIRIRTANNQSDALSWQLHDALGREVARGVGNQDFSIDVAHLPVGSYSLSLTTAKGRFFKAISIAR